MIPIPDPTAEFLPLPMAAALAYLRLVNHNQRERASEGLLDVVASALSVWLPVYGGEPRGRLSDELVGRGRFCNGATHLRFRDGTPPIENLAILQSDSKPPSAAWNAPACASPTQSSSRRRGACRACCRLPCRASRPIANAFTDAQAFNVRFGRRSLSSTGTRSIHWSYMSFSTRRQSRGNHGRYEQDRPGDRQRVRSGRRHGRRDGARAGAARPGRRGDRARAASAPRRMHPASRDGRAA